MGMTVNALENTVLVDTFELLEVLGFGLNRDFVSDPVLAVGIASFQSFLEIRQFSLDIIVCSHEFL